MGRIRTIKPEFWVSEQIVECSPNARLLFIGMWNFCDDGGNHPASPKSLKMQVFPGDDFTVQYISDLVSELENQGLIIDYQANDGKMYWHVTGWHHQKIDRPSFKYPKFDDNSSNDRRTPPSGRESKGKDSNGDGDEEVSHTENESQPKKENQKNVAPGAAADFKIEAYNPPGIDFEVDAMLIDDLCKERFFRQCQIPIDQFTSYAEDFRLKLKSEDHRHSNRKDFRSHFFSWARLENERAEKTKKNGTFKFRSAETINDALEFAEQWRNEERLGIPH